jgi:hypothetical protein
VDHIADQWFRLYHTIETTGEAPPQVDVLDPRGGGEAFVEPADLEKCLPPNGGSARGGLEAAMQEAG